MCRMEGALVRRRAVCVAVNLLQSYAAACSLQFVFGTREPQFFATIVFFMMLTLLQLGAADTHNRRTRNVAGLFALFFAVATLLANYRTLEAWGALFSFYTLHVLFMLWLLFFALLRMLYGRLRVANVYSVHEETRFSERQVFWSCFAALTVVYTVVFLCNYPGVVMADMRVQLAQIVGLDPYSNHHPMAHTLCMKVFFDFGYTLFGTQNAGIACICVSQYLFVSATFSYCVATLRKLGLRWYFLLAAAVFFAFAPHNLFFSVTMVKDIPFAMMVLLMLTVLLRLTAAIRDGDAIRTHWPECALLFVSALGVCVLRTNGIYAFAAFLAACLLLLRRREYLLLPILCGALLLAALFRGPVLDAMGVPPPDTIEALSVPSQHIARVVADGCELTPEETALLSKVVDPAAVARTYTSYIADPIKDLVRAEGDQAYLAAHKSEYFRLWMQLGLRYPGEYLMAEVDETVGFWYPNISYESLYMGGIHPESTRLSISTEPVIGGLAFWALRAYLTGTRDWTIFDLFFSIGTFTWIGIVLMGLAVINRKREDQLSYVFLLLLLGTLLIATPVHAEFRYFYAM